MSWDRVFFANSLQPIFPSRYSFTTFILNSVLYFAIKKLTSLSWFVSPTFGGQFKKRLSKSAIYIANSTVKTVFIFGTLLTLILALFTRNNSLEIDNPSPEPFVNLELSA